MTTLSLTALLDRGDTTDNDLIAAIQHSADVNTLVTHRFTILTWATHHRAIEVMTAALKAGANPNGLDDARWPPMYYAVAGENTDAIKLLIQWGATLGEISAATTGSICIAAPIVFACHCELIGVVQFLLPYMQDGSPYVDEAFKTAVDTQNTAVADLLLRQGVLRKSSVPTLGFEALCSACKTGGRHVVKLLVDAGVRPSNPHEVNQLWCAAQAAPAAPSTARIQIIAHLRNANCLNPK
jgi:hypothetical protein